MSFPPAYRDSPRNNTSYTGQTYSFSPIFYRKRDPTSLDLRPKEAQGYYPYGSLWFNTTGLNIWYLMKISAVAGKPNAFWVQLVEGSNTGPLLTLSDTAGTVVHPTSDSSIPPGNIQLVGGTGITVVSTPGSNLLTITNTGAGTETLTGDDGAIVSPIAGTIQTLGNTVANSTHAKALFTTNSAANIERFDIQVSAAIAAGDATKAGIAAFNNTQFTVNTTTGFVSLFGGAGAPTLGLTPDTFSGPGTSPVVPDGSGNIKLEGGIKFATGTQANPIRTNSLAANTIDFQIQLAGANAAVSTANNFGVAQFDSNSFTVASGFVTLNNAGTTGAVTKVLGDDGGGNTVVPSAGIITWFGSTVANATNAKPVFFKKNAASTEELDVQLTTTSTSGAKNINKSGLAHFDSADFTVDAATGFVSLVGGSSPAILGLVPDASTPPGTSPVVPNGSGNIILEGGVTYATGTRANPIRTNSLAANTIDLQIQLAGSNAAVSTANNFGVAQFDSNQFTVASGFVQLKGATGNPAIQDVDLDNATTPVFATAGGHISLKGGTIAATGTSSTAVQTSGSSNNDAKINLQFAGSNAAASTANNFGVAQFDSNMFTVASGFVQLKGGGVNPAVLSINLDAATSPIAANGSGAITITGGQVATGVVGANVIRTRGNTANSCTVEIQRTTVAGAANSALNGVCHFDSSKFSVDTNGFVTFIGSTSSFPWTDEGGNFNAASQNGYFCTALLTATLPPTPAQGDVVRFVMDTASVVTIAANTGQKIRMGNVISAATGTAASTKQGDSVDLVYRSASATWYAVAGFTGAWTIT